MNKTLIVVLVIVGIVALMFGGSYNSLVSMDENVKSNWSQVENQLQRRADLIPNLVSTVKGYAKHEQQIFTAIADARSKLIGAKGPVQTAQANDELSGALSRLLVVAENYPNLKADQNFRQLQDELAGTENRLAVARKDYNDSAQEYNSKIRSFPTVMVAGMFNFKSYEYFKAEEGAKAVPKVDFGQ
ncbi:MAG: LemA family protein [Acidobacteriota bacterium]